MTPVAPLDKAGIQLARKTLTLYARYAELMVMQETALDDGNLERFEALDDELSAVQNQLGLPPDGASSLVGDPQSDSMRSEAMESLREAQATHARIQTRLATLKEETGTEIRHLARDGSQARRYLEASTSSEGEDTPHFDVIL